MNVIDLFAGCGGLSYGFKNNKFNSIGFVEIDKHCTRTLKENFQNNKIKDNRFLNYDIQKIFKNNDNNDNLNSFFSDVNSSTIDGIIGGPPCQAYSLEGRARDPNGMTDDYRNYLFESYVEWLKKYQPKFFVLENVLGMLSAKPGGKSIPELLSRSLQDINFFIPEISKKIVYNLAEFGGAQNRKRVILFGVNQNIIKNPAEIIHNFYNNLDKEITQPNNVSHAIKDLPKIFPFKNDLKKISHFTNAEDPLHFPRFHNERDINIFKTLAIDLYSDQPKFISNNSKMALYNQTLGKQSKFQKYNVLKWEKPSNTICAHLQKDGLRYIHPDANQARSITMREAARLQSFPDNFKFTAPNMQIYKMIGNAVAPLMAEKIAHSIKIAFK